MVGLPKMAIVYQNGSLPPFEILAACKGLCEPIWVLDSGDPVMQSLLPLLRRVAPVVESDQAPVEEVAERVASHGPDGVITFAEDLPLAAAIAQAAGLKFHDPDTADRLTVKRLQRQLFHDVRLPSPRYSPVGRGAEPQEVLDHARRVGFPLVVKPEVGLGSRYTYRVDDEAELCRVLGEIDEDVVMEQLLAARPGRRDDGLGDVLMVDSLVRRGEPEHIAVTGHFPPAEPFRGTGSFIPSHFDDDEIKEILRVTEAAIGAIGVRDSYVNTDLIMTEDGPVVLEVNGRVGGQVPQLLEMLGVDGLLRDSIRFALGEEVEARSVPAGVGKVAFCAMYQPPQAARRLLGIDGTTQLRRLPGVTDLVINTRVGDPIDWREGTLSRLFTVYGVVADHPQLSALYRQIQHVVAPRYG